MSNLLDLKNWDFPRYYLNQEKTNGFELIDGDQVKVFKLQVTSLGTYVQINDMKMDTSFLLQVEQECYRVESPDFAEFLDQVATALVHIFTPDSSITKY